MNGYVWECISTFLFISLLFPDKIYLLFFHRSLNNIYWLIFAIRRCWKFSITIRIFKLVVPANKRFYCCNTVSDRFFTRCEKFAIHCKKKKKKKSRKHFDALKKLLLFWSIDIHLTSCMIGLMERKFVISRFTPLRVWGEVKRTEREEVCWCVRIFRK